VDRPVAFTKAHERAEDRLVLIVDGVPAAFAHMVKLDLIVGNTNGGQVWGILHVRVLSYSAYE
jgi:hypothetical protein